MPIDTRSLHIPMVEHKTTSASDFGPLGPVTTKSLQELRGYEEPVKTWIPGKVIEAMARQVPPKEGIEKTLQERGSQYGKFVDHAGVTQELKTTMQDAPKWHLLADDQREALDMIAHKIGRILCGNPNFHDSWHDIVGYAKLVADRLEGKVV